MELSKNNTAAQQAIDQIFNHTFTGVDGIRVQIGQRVEFRETIQEVDSNEIRIITYQDYDTKDEAFYNLVRAQKIEDQVLAHEEEMIFCKNAAAFSYESSGILDLRNISTELRQLHVQEENLVLAAFHIISTSTE